VAKIIINNHIRAKQVRLIDASGVNCGIVSLEEAIAKAKEAGMDLIQITEKLDPPVCRILEYGKYLYGLKKKQRKEKKQGGGIKIIRLGFNTSIHDLEIKAKQGENFLKEKNKVIVQLILRGREKALANVGKEKINKFLEILKNHIEIKLEGELKREAKGFTITIAKL